MFNSRKLRAAMVMAGKSVRDICKALDINPSTFYRKMEKDGDFSREEISILVKELNIDNPADIFFADSLTETQDGGDRNERNTSK